MWKLKYHITVESAWEGRPLVLLCENASFLYSVVKKVQQKIPPFTMRLCVSEEYLHLPGMLLYVEALEEEVETLKEGDARNLQALSEAVAEYLKERREACSTKRKMA